MENSQSILTQSLGPQSLILHSHVLITHNTHAHTHVDKLPLSLPLCLLHSRRFTFSSTLSCCTRSRTDSPKSLYSSCSATAPDRLLLLLLLLVVVVTHRVTLIAWFIILNVFFVTSVLHLLLLRLTFLLIADHPFIAAAAAALAATCAPSARWASAWSSSAPSPAPPAAESGPTGCADADTRAPCSRAASPH